MTKRKRQGAEGEQGADMAVAQSKAATRAHSVIRSAWMSKGNVATLAQLALKTG